MIVWFKCEEEGLMCSLETNARPMIGDIVRVKGNDYSVNKVVWCLEELPAQSGLLVNIKKL